MNTTRVSSQSSNCRSDLRKHTMRH